MPQAEILLEPGHDVARLDAWLDILAIGETFLGSQPAEVLRAFAGLCLDVLEVGLK